MPRTTTSPDGLAVALTEAQIDRVDGVAEPATDLPWLVIKAASPDDGAGLEIDIDDGADEDGETSGAGDEQDEDADGEDQDGDQDAADGEPEDDGQDDGGDGQPAAAQATDERIPGSATWEAADAATAHQVAAGLAGLRQSIAALADRESAEGAYGQDGAFSQATDLRNAAAMIDSALTILAKYRYAEAAAAGPAGTEITKSAALWGRLLSTPREADVLTDAQIRAIVADQVTKSLAAQPEAKQATKKSVAAAASAVDVSSVFKSALDGALEPLVAAQERVVDALAAVEERVGKVEKARIPGGPLLRGAAGVSPDGLWTVQRGRADTPAVDADQGAESLRKALGEIKDPRVRDAAGQAVATGLHPLMNSGKA
jgi:hypothetical protein